MSAVMKMAEHGFLPDPLVRWGIRRLVRMRLVEEKAKEFAPGAFAEELRRSPIALVPERANAQHYEVPPAFFKEVLGSRLKYSCCYWPEGVDTLDEAEEAGLRQICERAGIEDGMEILDLGCGWGSLSIWIAEHFPACRIVSVSNSAPQREFILAECSRRGVTAPDIRTADMNSFEPPGRYDRIISIEMFEHMRNYEELLHRISEWLKPGGRLFVHIFCHRLYAYPFETGGDHNWMGRNFFTGGIMPAEGTFDAFQKDLKILNRWSLAGTHYQKTSEAWLHNLDARLEPVRRALASGVRLNRWRMFFMACAELFGYRAGKEWFVAHYLFGKAGE